MILKRKFRTFFLKFILVIFCAASFPLFSYADDEKEASLEISSIDPRFLSENIELVLKRTNRELKRMIRDLDIPKHLHPKIGFYVRSNFYYEGLRILNLIKYIQEQCEKDSRNFEIYREFFSKLDTIYYLTARNLIVNLKFDSRISKPGIVDADKDSLLEVGTKMRSALLDMYFSVYSGSEEMQQVNNELTRFRLENTKVLIQTLRSRGNRASKDGSWTDEDRKNFLAEKYSESRVAFIALYNEIGGRVRFYKIPEQKKLFAGIDMLEHAAIEPSRIFPWGKVLKWAAILAAAGATAYGIYWAVQKLSEAAKNAGEKASVNVDSAFRNAGANTFGVTKDGDRAGFDVNGKCDFSVFSYEEPGGEITPIREALGDGLSDIAKKAPETYRRYRDTEEGQAFMDRLRDDFKQLGKSFMEGALEGFTEKASEAGSAVVDGFLDAGLEAVDGIGDPGDDDAGDRRDGISEAPDDPEDDDAGNRHREEEIDLENDQVPDQKPQLTRAQKFKLIKMGLTKPIDERFERGEKLADKAKQLTPTTSGLVKKTAVTGTVITVIAALAKVLFF